MQPIPQALLDQLRRSSPAAAPEAAEAYDWAVPHRFVAGQLRQLNELSAQIGRQIAQALGALLQTQMPIEPAAIREVYGRAVQPELVGGQYLTLSADARIGYLLVSNAQAGGWVERLLGQQTVSGADRAMSPLEVVLLQDALKTACAGAGRTLQQARLKGLKPAEALAAGNDASLDANQEFVRLEYTTPVGESKLTMTLLLAADYLAPAVAAGTAAAAENPEQIRKTMLDHVQRLSLPASAVMGTTLVPMRDLMTLQPGDVVLLGWPLDQPVDLLVQGRLVLQGYAVSCQGQAALEISSRMNVPSAGQAAAQKGA